MATRLDEVNADAVRRDQFTRASRERARIGAEQPQLGGRRRRASIQAQAHAVARQSGNGRVVGGIDGVETEAKRAFEEGDVSGEVGGRQATLRPRIHPGTAWWED